MAGEDVTTKLPLARWAQIMGINPLHFAGVQIPSVQNSACDSAWFTFEWQDDDRVGRNAVARAIAEAEAEIEHALGYRLAPAWEVDEWQQTFRPSRPELFNLNARDVRGMAQTVEARWGHFISGGVRATATIEADAPITWSSTIPPTSYQETGTVTVTVEEGLDPCEVAVYYPGEAGNDRWRIRPVEVAISGTTATITFRRELAIIVDRILSLDIYPEEEGTLRPVNGTVDAEFLSVVDVVRVYNDPQTQGVLLWESPPSCGCGGSGCATCGYGTQTACLGVRGDPRLSLVTYQPATWDADAETFTAAGLGVGRNPDVVRLNYYAGLRDRAATCPTLQMTPQWERVVAYFAASKLDRPPCTCSTEWYNRWASDLAFSGGAEELATYRLAARDLRNPFGTRRGAVQAWHAVTFPGAAIGAGVHA